MYEIEWSMIVLVETAIVVMDKSTKVNAAKIINESNTRDFVKIRSVKTCSLSTG